jgi:hypothetical protein
MHKSLDQANQLDVSQEDDGGFRDSDSNAMIVEEHGTASNSMPEEEPEGNGCPHNDVQSVVSQHPTPAPNGPDYSVKEDQPLSIPTSVPNQSTKPNLPSTKVTPPVPQNTPIDDPVLPVHDPEPPTIDQETLIDEFVSGDDTMMEYES